jgi:hypothetical protein
MQTAIAFLLLAVFGVALVAKLDAWPDWRGATANWFRSTRVTRLARWLIPTAEALVIVALGTRTRTGLGASAVVLLAFSIGAAGLALRGVNSACACFGATSPSTIGPSLVARNLTLAALGVAGFLLGGGDGRMPLALVVTALVLVTTVLLLQEFRALGLARRGSQD